MRAEFGILQNRCALHEQKMRRCCIDNTSSITAVCGYGRKKSCDDIFAWPMMSKQN